MSFGLFPSSSRVALPVGFGATLSWVSLGETMSGSRSVFAGARPDSAGLPFVMVPWGIGTLVWLVVNPIIFSIADTSVRATTTPGCFYRDTISR